MPQKTNIQYALWGYTEEEFASIYVPHIRNKKICG